VARRLEGGSIGHGERQLAVMRNAQSSKQEGEVVEIVKSVEPESSKEKREV
jgi:hypothetical protein